jgi:hypothetical protein
MIIATPSDQDLCVAPELAILAVIEVSLAVAIKVLNIAHTEILAPAAESYHPPLDARIAAEIIAQATRLLATVNRYHLALRDPDFRQR